ncbi:Zinc finger C-x8-C-x5-C-x3-H type (and similar) [Carex littledalei]|uniref:Zinc finger C-x8-C-x5-C-x3-H type (And similar) n=1 Tax=Carex littledalei TaxID=544730 RepID=A0A833VKR8_9POAL|nr:Zinc finger C-x8-C-x5-C-x3-H type (and similar) [Carex littledalei]
MCFPQPHGKDKSSIPCYYFLRGYCGRGANCSFMHAPPSSSQEQPQKNSPLPRPINPEDNPPPPKEQNNNPGTSESESDISFDVIVGDNPSYFLQGADWYGSSNYFTSQIQEEWCRWPEYYNSYERTLHRPSLSGRKRPLEQEAESEIRMPDVGPVTVACTNMRVADDEEQNGHSSCGGILSSRLRGRIRFPEQSISAAAYHSKERRDSPNSHPVQNKELVHSRCNHERERGITDRSEINASDFPAPKSLAELKRAKIVKEQNDNSSLEEENKKVTPSGGDK